jgi:hypothetical protein
MQPRRGVMVYPASKDRKTDVEGQQGEVLDWPEPERYYSERVRLPADEDSAQAILRGVTTRGRVVAGARSAREGTEQRCRFAGMGPFRVLRRVEPGGILRGLGLLAFSELLTNNLRPANTGVRAGLYHGPMGLDLLPHPPSIAVAVGLVSILPFGVPGCSSSLQHHTGSTHLHTGRLGPLCLLDMLGLAASEESS